MGRIPRLHQRLNESIAHQLPLRDIPNPREVGLSFWVHSLAYSLDVGESDVREQAQGLELTKGNLRNEMLKGLNGMYCLDNALMRRPDKDVRELWWWAKRHSD